MAFRNGWNRPADNSHYIAFEAVSEDSLSMRVKITARKNKRNLWDNQLVITGWRSSGWTMEEIKDLLSDNGGILVKEKPLTFKIYDCAHPYENSVEVDNTVINLKRYSDQDVEVI